MSATAGIQGIAPRVVAAASALFWLVLFFGVIDLIVPLHVTSDFYDVIMLEVGWGVLYGVLAGAAFVSLAVRPGSVAPLCQVLLASGSLAVTAVAAGAWGQLAPAAGLAVDAAICAWLARRPARPERVRQPPGVDPVVGVVAFALLVVAVPYAVDMITAYRTGSAPTDNTMGIDHRPTQAAAALAVGVIACAVARGVRAGWPGVAVSTACVAAGVAWFGVCSAVYRERVGSADRAGGLALIGWSIVFVVVVGRRRTRRGPAKAT